MIIINAVCLLQHQLGTGDSQGGYLDVTRIQEQGSQARRFWRKARLSAAR